MKSLVASKDDTTVDTPTSRTRTTTIVHSVVIYMDIPGEELNPNPQKPPLMFSRLSWNLPKSDKYFISKKETDFHYFPRLPGYVASRVYEYSSNAITFAGWRWVERRSKRKKRRWFYRVSFFVSCSNRQYLFLLRKKLSPTPFHSHNRDTLPICQCDPNLCVRLEMSFSISKQQPSTR